MKYGVSSGPLAESFLHKPTRGDRSMFLGNRDHMFPCSIDPTQECVLSGAEYIIGRFNFIAMFIHDQLKESLVRVIKSVLIIIILLSMPSACSLLVFPSHFLEIMKNLSDPKTETAIKANLTKPFNFTELIEWEHGFLRFVPMNETFENRSTDPIDILLNGKGRCEEFSILYVSACLALGYQARLLVAVHLNIPVHVWAEVKINGSWIHVDPSDSVWNQPSHYKTFTWGNQIGTLVDIYAFENGTIEDRTQYYRIMNSP